MRTSLRLAAATIGIVAPLALAAPAHAGGGPEFGTVTFAPTGSLSTHQVTLTGTYRCDDLGQGTGWFEVELLQRGSVRARVAGDATCDGDEHAFSLTTWASGVTPGSAYVVGLIYSIDGDGNTPANMFEQDVALTRGR